MEAGAGFVETWGFLLAKEYMKSSTRGCRGRKKGRGWIFGWQDDQ